MALVQLPWWFRLGAVALVAHGAWNAWLDRPVEPPPGVLAPKEPRQGPPGDAAPLVAGEWTLTPRAEFTVVARVLGRERYRFDAIADVVPVDVALGWGPMSDGAVLAELDIEQSARYVTVRWGAEPPLPAERLMRHLANVHAIPADDAVRRGLLRLRRGQLVELSGRLVDGESRDGRSFRTSLTREDTGANACEVLRVERLRVLDEGG